MNQTDSFVSAKSNENRHSYVLSQLPSALLKLLSEKPLAQISITKLVRVAGVGHASFYRNFFE
ncbi:TetR/AcrR family transcriptional regulator [Alloscardovia omnicolens]|uniref:TetR/AcrR family transcriptional regulator n=1 Tax=Alloscardovia omnicolens TaxID=419015 RepID=UPI0040557F61